MCHLHCTYTEREANDITIHLGIQPNKVLITKLKLDKNGKTIFACKPKSCKAGKEKGKYKEGKHEKMQE